MKIEITGQITDTHYDGCYCPQDLKDKLDGVDPSEPLEIEITSEGGSVFAGIQIANILSRHQGKVTTHAVGLCASIATVILMAGDEICVDSNCFFLVHLPWTDVTGNAKDLAKEIETLDKCKQAMMGYYTKHSKVDDGVISEYVENETWFLGSEFAEVFDCKVIECDQQLNIAARCDLSRFNKIDKRILSMSVEEKEKIEKLEQEEETPEEEKTEETQVEEKTEEKTEETPAEEKTEETKVEEVVEETTEEEKPTEEEKTEEEKTDDVEALRKRCSELEEEVEKLRKELEEPTDKRVSGMQAKMQLKLNDCESKYKDLVELKDKEIKLRDAELESIKAEATSLKSKLDDVSGNYEKAVSALREKETALLSLNSNVLQSPSDQASRGWGDLVGDEFRDYMRRNNNIIKITNK